MIINDTICAVATAHGAGGISIVRLSGDLAVTIAKRITKKKSFEIRYAHLCDLFDQNGDFIDEAIVIFFQSPKSFTGEDVVEFQSHGGFVTATRIIDACIAYGARGAMPGEFSKRAVIHGKTDLSRVEAAARLIESKSVDAAKILSRQLKGELQKFVDEIRDELVEILAFIEVNIDYAEEDLPDELQTWILEKLENIYHLLNKSIEASKSRIGIIEGYKVAIVGKPNVGKSSLLNALLRYERAIVSDIEGTTRDTVEESINISTHLVRIVDTAGIRKSSDEIEKIGIKRSVEAIKEADIIIALFDASRRFDQNDEEILQLLKDHEGGKDIIVVLNKSDLERKMDFKKLLPFEPMFVSVTESTKQVIKMLEKILNAKSEGEDTILINSRQIETTKRACEAIERSFSLLKSGEPELFAYEINEAIDAVSSITRPFYRDEILDKMFASFCLGK